MEKFEKIVLRRLGKAAFRSKVLSQYSTYKYEEKKKYMEALERKGYISSESFFTLTSKKQVTEYSLTKKGDLWVKENIRSH